MRTKKSFAAISALALIMLAACGGGGGTTAPANNTGTTNTGGNTSGGGTTPTPPGVNEVIARTTDSFDPASLTVAIGTTVSFTFEATGHNVTFNAAANGRPADITGINSNTTITRQFNTAGTFGYQCTIHANMTGTVIVQ
jgi:plastocyanin